MTDNFIHMDIPDTVRFACDIIANYNGKPYIIGGAVRDHIYNQVWDTDIEIKDWDVEVHGMTAGELEYALTDNEFDIHEDGKSFSVFRATMVDMDIEFSLPRRDVKVAEGHRAFVVEPDPDMSLKEAARRRDFTMNAIFYDPINKVFHDPWYGITDIKCRKLKIVDRNTFWEDPLRYYRAAQFMARYNLSPCCVTQKELYTMAVEKRDELLLLPKERLTEELRKLFVKGVRPSSAYCLLARAPIFEDILPPLKGIKQDPTWHPEGNVDVHTCQVMDFARDLLKNPVFSDDDRFAIGMAALFHDIGKATTTIEEDGKIKSPGHALVGSTMTADWLYKYTNINMPDQLRISALVRQHMTIAQLYQNHLDGINTDKALRRLSLKLADKNTSLRDLEILWLADRLGRHDPEMCMNDAYEKFGMNNLSERAIWVNGHRNYAEPPKPILMGRHLQKLWPERVDGVWMGAVLDTAFAMQLNNDDYDLLDGLYLARTLIENTPDETDAWLAQKKQARAMIEQALDGEEQ